MKTGSTRYMLAFACWLAAGAAWAQAGRLDLDELGDLSLEQLGRIQVTSVSRRSERLLDAPASVYAISAEDIRRSGARTLPEALRLAPNLQVAATTAGQWAISARGFNNAIGNKLLVLVDGRTVYSPLFSGVFWDAQGMMLEDIERVEVISGPGATLWGANAVNGVINVTTRPAAATQGTLAAASGGDGDRQYTLRHGGRLGTAGHWRLYGTRHDRDRSSSGAGALLSDGAHRTQVGGRADWTAGADSFTVQGDAYRGGHLPGLPQSPKLSGENLLARMARQENGASWRLQAYYDHARRDEPLTFRDEMEVLDLDWQHSPAMPKGHKLTWGAGHRQARDKTGTSLLATFIPPQRRLRWTNVFLQDTFTLTEQFDATLGAKLESNVYTGVEFLPSARLAWTPSPRHSGWAALSRAVRAPARLDRDFFFPGTAPFLIRGGPDFESEVANVLEAGWRAQPSPGLSYSITVFHARYDKLRSGQPPPAVVQNMIEGSTSGLEAWGHWQATRDWRLSAGLSELRSHLRLKPGSTDPTGPSVLGNDPRHQAQLRSSLNLGGGHEFDVSLRHVSALPSPTVDAYTVADARWGWRLSSQVELSFNVQNLLDRRHIEFGTPANASQLGRQAWFKLVWRQ